MTIKYLDWDSTFFNKKIGLLEITNDVQSFDIENDYDVIYVMSNTEISINIANYEKSYSETKIVFSKMLVRENILANGNIFSILNSYPKKKIYDLAFESGKFSRFKLDPNFRQSDFEKLYKIWIDNSFNKKFADDVLVYKDQNIIKGFVSYRISEEFATIGLIAICPEHQGKGIGKKLLESVEKKLFTIGIKELRIPTQLQNEIACEFYTKMGYTIIQEKIVIHYWKL